MKIYRCNVCGNIFATIDDKKMAPSCCQKTMELVCAKNTDEFAEKHVPVTKYEGNKVIITVGEVSHPMGKDHYIEWILMVTDKGFGVRYLHPGDAPCAEFVLMEGETLKGAYAYCNIHGLWMKDDCNEADC